MGSNIRSHTPCGRTRSSDSEEKKTHNAPPAASLGYDTHRPPSYRHKTALLRRCPCSCSFASSCIGSRPEPKLRGLLYRLLLRRRWHRCGILGARVRLLGAVLMSQPSLLRALLTCWLMKGWVRQTRARLDLVIGFEMMLGRRLL